MKKKTAFDVWCLVHPDYRQQARRYIAGNRPDLSRSQVTEELNAHINASTPMLIARGKKLRYWVSLSNTRPPWARELHLYQEGFGPTVGETIFCDRHVCRHDAAKSCPICTGECLN